MLIGQDICCSYGKGPRFRQTVLDPYVRGDKTTAEIAENSVLRFGLEGLFKSRVWGNLAELLPTWVLHPSWSDRSGALADPANVISSSPNRARLLEARQHCNVRYGNLFLLRFLWMVTVAEPWSNVANLADREDVLDWNSRMRIAVGSAKGIAYLHEVRPTCYEPRRCGLQLSYPGRSLYSDLPLCTDLCVHCPYW